MSLQGGEGDQISMPTIIKYTDRERPKNEYPKQIISPVRSGPCCFSDMEDIGDTHQDKRWIFTYKRCRQCGFAVRVILREVPDSALVAALRKSLTTAFVRNVPA